MSSILQLVPAAWAEGTTGGTVISNTAKATYSDNTGVPQPPATSNTVTVTVAEVAGIAVTSAGVTAATPGSPITPGTTIYYDYTITNTGNDTTKFTIPNFAQVTTGPGSVSGNLLVNGVPISGGSVTTADIPVGGTVTVRVPVLVSPTATAGQQILVQLGNTPGNAQNQERTGATSEAGDVFTVDGTGAADVPGAPVNGVREASATATATVGSVPQAFAAILKNSVYSDNGTASTLTDDKITYGLSLRVDSAAPLGSANGYSAAPLNGTSIKVDNVTAPKILVADAIPANTVLTGTPVAPAGWTVVYTADSTATTPDSTLASWTTTVPSGPVTRVGFVNNGPVNAGTTVTGFSFQVVTSNIPTTGGGVSNIAQVFGTTSGSTTLVYDESGDQNPSNFSDGPTPTPTPYTPTSTTNNGVANPTTDGTDPGNNTGTGPNGEDNIVTVAPPSAVLNGPFGAPTAIGPTSNNDDFTNKAAPLATGSSDPGPAAFTGTVKNTAASATAITVVPGTASTPTAIPNGTIVTVSYGGQSASYTYTAGVPTIVPGNTPVVIPASDLPPNGVVNYGVSVDLPNNTPKLIGFPVPVVAFIDGNSDGSPTGDPQNISIDRVYVGFVNLTKTAQVLSADGSTVIVPAGTALTGNIAPGSIIEYTITYKNISEAQAGSGNNATLDAKDIVITEDGTLGSGGNNWALDNDVNGKSDTSNILNSAADSGSGSVITFFSGSPAGTSAIADQTGTTPTTDVTKYVDTVAGPVGPSISRTFTFRRRIN